MRPFLATNAPFRRTAGIGGVCSGASGRLIAASTHARPCRRLLNGGFPVRATLRDNRPQQLRRRAEEGRLAILPVADCHMEQWSQLVHHRDKVLTPQIRAMVSVIAQVENIPLHLED